MSEGRINGKYKTLRDNVVWLRPPKTKSVWATLLSVAVVAIVGFMGYVVGSNSATAVPAVVSTPPVLVSVSPAPPVADTGPAALCVDGTLSYSKVRPGTCSSHGGVKTWLK
jgi:hypothetical protein